MIVSRFEETTMTQEPVSQEEEKKPQYQIPRGLYIVTGAVMALWVFVTFFLRNPYTQAVSIDYYDKHPYDENTTWVLVLVIIPMIGLAAFIAWTRRRQGNA
jgi:hypothetical protein